jgi:hypothetical protein
MSSETTTTQPFQKTTNLKTVTTGRMPTAADLAFGEMAFGKIGGKQYIFMNFNGQITQVSTDSKKDQTVSGIENMTRDTLDSDFVLSATSTSGLEVTLTSSNPSVAYLDGNTLHLTGTAGTATITASQGGNSSWNAAPDVSVTLTVNTATVWTTKTPMLMTLKAHTATPVNSYIYVMGGSKDYYNATNTVYRYEISTQKWETMAPMPQIRSNHVAIKSDSYSKINVIGGVDNGATPKDNNWEYQFDNDVWVEREGGQQVTRAKGIIGRNSYGWIIGGCDDSVTPTRTIRTYNWNNNTWSTAGNLDTQNADFAAVKVNDSLYVIGGYPGGTYGGTLYDNTWWMDLNDPYSSFDNRSPFPVPVNKHCAAELNGKIYVFGGSTETQAYNSFVYCYTPETDSWQQKTSMNIALTEAVAVTMGNRIYILGGLTSSGRINTVQVYTPSLDV